MNKKINSIIKYLFLFGVGGLLYCLIELVARGYSHWTMILCGGICFVMIGLTNNIISWDMPFWKQAIIGDCWTLLIEFITGCIVNLWLGWNVWDYSKLPGNILGQICPQFALIWLLLVCLAIVLDDYLRHWFFGEEKPHYIWF